MPAKTTTRKPTAAKAAPATPTAAKKKPAAKAARIGKAKGDPAASTKAGAGKSRTTTKKHKPAEKKQKTVRDSFNMPAGDYELIGQLKKRAIALGREIKKSELLRAGVKALATMKEAAFAEAVAAVAAIKTGRPSKKRK